MKIGVLSDTHNQVERTATAVRLLQEAGARALFHCGDLTGTGVARACCRLPAYVVCGNNDVDVAALEKELARRGGVWLGPGGEVPLGGRRIAVTHGHSPQIVHSLLSHHPDYLLRGHSHRKGTWREGKTRIVNPGALHRADPWTVALVDLSSDEVRFLEIPHPHHY